MAQHQVERRGVDLEVVGVALQGHELVLDAGLAGPAGQGGQGVGARVDDGDPMAERRERHREATGAAAEVEDVERPGSSGSRPRTASHSTESGTWLLPLARSAV